METLNKSNNTLDYGSTPIGTLIRKLAIPGIITMIVGSLNMVADGVFMGNFIGSDALAAVNLMMPVMMVVFGLIELIAGGSSVRIGILLGEGKNKEASQTFAASTLLIFVMGLIITFIGLLFAKPVIFSLIKDENLAILAYDYAKVFIPAIPVIAPLFAFDNYLRLCGRVNQSMYINVFVSIMNISLNIYFIVYLGLGISFAALATVISMAIGSILSIFPFLRKKLTLTFKKPVIPFKDIKMIIYNGSSGFFESISGAIMGFITNALLLSLAGASGVAAMSIITYIEMLLMPVLIGVIMSIQPIISYNFGAKNHARIKETFKKVSIISIIISLGALGIIIIFPDFLVSLFASEGDREMIKIATTGLLLYAPSYIFTWFNILVGTFLTSFEKPKESIILMSLESLVFPIAFFLILSQVIGLYGMFLAQTIAAAATFIVSVVMWKKIKVSGARRPS